MSKEENKVKSTKSLAVALAVIILIVLGAVLSVMILSSEKVAAPLDDSSSSKTDTPYKEGQAIELSGETVCLRHRGQNGPTTMECAFGFLSNEGRYYALRDAENVDSMRIANLPSQKTINIKGIYRINSDSKYEQSGTIELLSFTE